MSCGRMMLPRTLARILSLQLASPFCSAAACWRARRSRIWRSWRSLSSAASCCCSRAACSRIIFSNARSGLGFGFGFASSFGSGLGFGLGFSGSAMSGFLISGSGSGLTTGGAGGGGFGASTTGAGGGGGGASHSSTSTLTGAELWNRTPRNSTAMRTAWVSAESATDGPSAGSRRPYDRVAAVIRDGSLGELHLKAHAVNALLLELVHHLQHGFVTRVLVAADEHRKVGVLAAHLLDRIGQFAARDRALADDGARAIARADDEAAVGLDEHLERHDARLAGLRHARQVDHGRRDERRGHHEDHQQHQHHVDVRHDVDLVHGTASTDG